jgi:CRP-like cAMP-binding protein
MHVSRDTVAHAVDAPPTAWLARFQEVVADGAQHAGAAGMADVLRAAAAALERTGHPLGCRIVPPEPGNRPAHEGAHPGLGSSEEVAVIVDGDQDDPACVLYALPGAVPPGVEVRGTLFFTGPDGRMPPVPVPGWQRRPVEPRCFALAGDGSVRLSAVERTDDPERRLVFALYPARELLPGSHRPWSEFGPELRAGATGADPFTFGHRFSQQVRVDLQVTWEGVPVAGGGTTLLVCDLRRCGSLYARVLDRLVGPDTERQASAAGIPNPGPAYHPWFPVLAIGADKAALYTRALVQDITGNGQHLSDPGWLMRLGLNLEFLTFLGICEAVAGDVGDLLTEEERAAFDDGDCFADLRSRVDARAWRDVWELRQIAFPRRGVPRAGPVALTNLLAKKRATMRFLEVHHADLRHAIELAGRNHHNAQETWQRVFRDAERAVLRRTPGAFPELGFLSEQARDFVLWHRRGRFELGRTVRLPGAVTALFADQDGLFGAASSKYRASMNEVADWAKQHGLMDHTGVECVPRQVSLLEARVNQPDRVATLQRGDGYGPDLEVDAEPPAAFQRPAAEIEGLLAALPLFAMLPPDEVAAVARTARPLTLGPTERLVVQGQEGGSLFVVAEGEVEVLLRREDGEDVTVDTMGKGSVVGEMSLLTGERRSATVRAIEGAVAYEIGARQYGPCLRRHPELVTDLAAIMHARLEERREALHTYDSESGGADLIGRIRRAFFAS